MKVSDFLKDRLAAYLIRLISCVLIIIFLMAFRLSFQGILLITAIDIMAFIFYELWELYRKRGFYGRIKAMTAGLDKKYLLPEMLDQPDFYEGRLIYDALCECGKSMAENVSGYRKQAEDFREYIELWVHEAKLPIASLGLLVHNHPEPAGAKMNVQLKRLNDCIDNVLYYARSENAEKDYIIKEVSLKKVFSGVAVKNREAILSSGGSLSTSGLDARVMTDGKWLEFILGQLMSNSLKYAAKKRPLKISVSAEALEQSVTLRFRDNGIGISGSDIPYVFEKSFTGKNGRMGAASTGMGLYIVKSLCDRLGHGIGISSKEDEYTEITLTFFGNDFYKP